MTYARIQLSAAVDVIAEELDAIIGRICRTDSVLALRREDGVWRVYDIANGDAKMTPETHTSLNDALRFAGAFIATHPEARLDDSWAIQVGADSVEYGENLSHSRAVPSNVVPIRREVSA